MGQNIRFKAKALLLDSRDNWFEVDLNQWLAKLSKLVVIQLKEGVKKEILGTKVLN